MKSILCLGLTLLFFTSAVTVRAEDEFQPILAQGLKAYQESGAKAAVTAWLKGSPVARDVGGTVQLTEGLAKVEELYGDMKSAELIRTVHPSPSWQRTYLLIKYENGPLYVSVDSYQTATGWVIISLFYNTNANIVIPTDIINGEKH